MKAIVLRDSGDLGKRPFFGCLRSSGHDSGRAVVQLGTEVSDVEARGSPLG
jgi:hypothetical protein